MKLSGIYGQWRGREVYIVGTAPSMRLFPEKYLHGKRIIGLNQAYRYCDPQINLTVHPELIVEQREVENGKKRPWATKPKPPMKDLKEDDPDIYVFKTSTDLAVVGDNAQPLYLGHGIQCTALDLAVRMGAYSIIIVGCDMNALGGDHHGHAQHVRFHGLPPDDVYKEYRIFASRVRRVVREKHNVTVLTLSPFLGQDAASEDYLRLTEELALPKLPTPEDTSAYDRKSTDS